MKPRTGLSHGSGLEEVARPLLNLVQHICGMETSFLTAIDLSDQSQEILFSLNTGALQLQEGSRVDWKDSMCRSVFLSGRSHSCALGSDVPVTPGAVALGMNSFFAVPIIAEDVLIGTVCGASREVVELDPGQLHAMELIAKAIRHMLTVELARVEAIQRADEAQADARAARSMAEHHASTSVHMERLAHVDVLTGLPNRRAFIAGWENELARSARRNYPIGLILIDADKFKTVNDSHGHLAGDAILQLIGRTLLEVATSADMVARLGGDEFAMVTTHASPAALLATAEKIRVAFARAASGLGMDSTLSFGIATSDTCARPAMLANADKALYSSKAAGGNRVTMYRLAVETNPG